MKYTFKQINNVRKETEWWFRRFLLQPIFAFVTWVIANFFPLEPNAISILVIVCGVISGFAFFWGYLGLGAIYFFLMILLDAVDGAIARLTNKTSKLGVFLDNFAGSIGFLPVILGLGYGQLIRTNDLSWFLIVMTFFFFKSIKFWTSIHFSNIMGVKYDFIEKSNKKTKDIFSKIKRFLIKHRIREPFAEKDMAIVGLVIGPFTPYFKEFMILAIIGLGINLIMWTTYYFVRLKDEK